MSIIGNNGKKEVIDRKRPYAHLVVEPPEKIKIVRSLKGMLDEDNKMAKHELQSLKCDIARVQELIQDKVNDFGKMENVSITDMFNKLLKGQSQVLLGKILDFVDIRDLANCRLVNRQWQVAASDQIKIRKTLKLVSFQYRQSISELSATQLVRNIPRRHSLFGFQKFEVSMGLYSTLLMQFLDVYAPHVKFLHLQFDNARSSNNGGVPWSNDFTRCLTLSRLENCSHFEISNFPVTNETLQSFPSVIPVRNQITVLKFTIDYRGAKANYIGPTSYYGKLLQACPSLAALALNIKCNCNVESGDIMQNVVVSMNQAELKNLKKLSLEWEDGRTRSRNQKPSIGKIDFPQLLPALFKLRYLKLINFSCATLLPFLKYHSNSLAMLKIHFWSKSEIIDIKINHLLQLQLPRLTKLNLPACLPAEETNHMLQLMMGDHFPTVSCIKLSEFGSKLQKTIPDFNTSVTRLKLEMDNTSAHAYQKVLEFVDAFPYVQDLRLKHASQQILRNIWKTSLRSTLTEFSISESAKPCDCLTSHDAYELDSILTGFSPQFCKKILLNDINTQVFFDLNSFDIDKWKDQWLFLRPKALDSSQEHVSIACFESLRKLTISYPRGHITEVGMIYAIRTLKRLTSLTIQHSSIRKYFVLNIRDSLGLPFHLEIDCVDG